MEIWGHPGDVVRRLQGVWTLDRTVDDRPLLTGRATFTAMDAGHLAYVEHGQMRLPDGRELEATRRYEFQPTPTGFAVFFAETPPRLFHTVALQPAGDRLVGHASHLCGADNYVSGYEFRDDGTFVIRHKVIGPRKDYRLDTLYRRDPSAQ